MLPSPSIYFYFKYKTGASTAEFKGGEAADNARYSNPVHPDSVDGDAFDVDDETNASATRSRPAGPLESREEVQNRSFSPAAVAKLNRVARENRIDNEVLSQQLAELTQQNEQLRLSVIASGGDLSGVPDPNPTRKSKTAEPDQQQQLVEAPSDPRQSSILAMKALVEDETLSEENRAAAKDVLDFSIQDSIKGELANATLHRLQRVVQQEDNVEMLNKARLESIRKRNATAFAKVQEARTELRNWLGDIRLISHEQRFLEVSPFVTPV